MAITEKKKLKLKIEIEAGKLSRAAIGKKYKVSLPTLRKFEREEGWEYRKFFAKVSEQVSKKVVANIIERETEKLTDLTDEFFTDVNTYKNLSRAMANDVIAALKKAKEDSKGGKKVSVSKDEFDRIFSGSKIVKINIEALSIAYDRLRKAHGMDIPEKGAYIEINAQNQTVITDEESCKLFADALEM